MFKNKRLVEDGNGLRLVKLTNLQCSGCIHKMDPVFECQVYTIKPKGVLDRTCDCEDFVQPPKPQKGIGGLS